MVRSQPDRQYGHYVAYPPYPPPSSAMRLKQRIARLLIQEIIAKTDEPAREIVLVIHWVGGRHAEVRVPRPKPGEHRHWTSPDADGVVRRMAGGWPDHEIAACLNRLHLRTGAGNTWTASRVLSVRKRLRLVDYDAAAAKPMLTLSQAADRLGVGPWVVRRTVCDAEIATNHRCVEDPGSDRPCGSR